MEIIGDDKRIRALCSETRFADGQTAPSFTSVWHRAQSRADQPRRVFNLAFVSAVAILIVAVASFGVWLKYSQPSATFSASADVKASASFNPPTSIKVSDAVKSIATVVRTRSVKSGASKQALIAADNRKSLNEAKGLAGWQSPTASLLSSSSDQLFKSLPQLNQNATELKSFLPSRDNEKEK